MAKTPEPLGKNAFDGDFRLSITKALGDQLADAISGLDRAPLSPESLNTLKPRAGVYQLYLDDEFVYVGKADKSLPKRITKHLRKISGRENIFVSQMTFNCLYVAEDFSALAPEKLLIALYKADGAIRWNNMGFGNNDPGRKRDTTEVKENHFDALYPADLTRVPAGMPVGEMSLRELIGKLKAKLPYNFRFETKNPGKAYYAKVHVPEGDLTAADYFALIGPALPENWQIAVLPGYAIMYPDDRCDYPSARRYYRGSTLITATPVFAEAEDIEEDSGSDDDA